MTEIYGPPGVGKTAFAMQTATNALRTFRSEKIVWIDTAAPLAGPRFMGIFANFRPPVGVDPPFSPPSSEASMHLLDNVTYFNIPLLPHLLTLFLHPTNKFPPSRTSLIVVDNISSPVTAAFPRPSEVGSGVSTIDSARKAAAQRAAKRKWEVAGDLSAAMAKMASMRNIAILVVNQVATSLKGVRKAVLMPALSGDGWDSGIQNRLCLYRDFAPVDNNDRLNDDERKTLRFAEVVRLAGKSVTRSSTAFVIENVMASVGSPRR